MSAVLTSVEAMNDESPLCVQSLLNEFLSAALITLRTMIRAVLIVAVSSGIQSTLFLNFDFEVFD